MGRGPPSSYPVWSEARPPPPPICLVLLERGDSKSKSQKAPRPHTRLQVRTKDKTLWPRLGTKLPYHTLSVFIAHTLFWNLLHPYHVPRRLWCCDIACGFIKITVGSGIVSPVSGESTHASDLSYCRLHEENLSN